jgi:hypothetical protein
VEDVEPAEHPEGDTVVRLACLDDDANGQRLEVFWEREVDRQVLGASTWDTVGQRGFDQPQVFGSYLNTLRWNCVTSTDPGLFQSPLRAGIDVKPYQLEPLRKALRMPRVSLFIADDVGLGKTIEAGLILRELLLRQKVHRVVVIAPPSVVLQWKGEMESRFGLGFAVMDRAYISEMRRQRGWGINPWATHTRFILSQALVRDEAYAGPLRDWLGEEGKQALLILDEAHNAAPASGSKFAIDSKLTRAIRDLAGRFEHSQFVGGTPHNTHGNIDTSCSFGLEDLETEDRTQFHKDLQEHIDSGELRFGKGDRALVFQSELRSACSNHGNRRFSQAPPLAVCRTRRRARPHSGPQCRELCRGGSALVVGGGIYRSFQI